MKRKKKHEIKRGQNRIAENLNGLNDKGVRTKRVKKNMLTAAQCI